MKVTAYIRLASGEPRWAAVGGTTINNLNINHRIQRGRFMSLINTEIKPFKATAFKDGKFIDVTEASVKGKWSVFFFYPADFTFVCPTELEDLAEQPGRVRQARRRDLRRLDRHPLQPQGLARHVEGDRQDQDTR